MRIAIAGFGLEGKTSYEYWNTPEHEVVIVDEHDGAAKDAPLDAAIITGADAFTRLNGFDLVIRSPGIAPDKIVTDGRIWSATNEFFDRCHEKRVPVIGVTGSKGKGTTSSLIAAMLRAAGKTVHLVGNIGVPALEVVSDIHSDDIVVYELSSFQLWDAQRSPQVAVVLMIEPDHLDVHADFEQYVAAKTNITVNQVTTDRVVYNIHNQWSVQVAEASVGQRLPFPSERTAHVRDGAFYYHDNELCTLDQLQLTGKHNIENACAAITAVWPWLQDGRVIAEGLRSFDGLPHRLKFVREVNAVRYYDDSIATTPGSAIAAIHAFIEPKIIILGGSSKGASYADIIKDCKATDTRVIAMGETSRSIETHCQKEGVYCEHAHDIDSAVETAFHLAAPGSVVLLSPASASFDMFKNYADRGNQFIAAVDRLVEQPLGDVND